MPTKKKKAPKFGTPTFAVNAYRIEEEAGPGYPVPTMVHFTRKPNLQDIANVNMEIATRGRLVMPSVDAAGCSFRVELTKVPDPKPKAELKGTSPTDEGRRLNLVLSPELFETLEAKSRAKGLKVGQWTRSLIIAALNEPALQNV